MRGTPPPNPRELLPPLLACLPTSFLSPRPPPALLPLLSPILRQRVHLFSASASANSSSNSERPESSGGWLRKLTWSDDNADRLTDIVSTLQIEPHPVSGEIELFGDAGIDPDAGRVWYRRVDVETLQARCDVKEYRLGVVWLWTVNDGGGTGLEALQGEESKQNGEAQDGWKVAELIPLQGDEDARIIEEEGWSATIAESEAKATAARDALGKHASPGPPAQSTSTQKGSADQDDSSDDDYWAAYDRTPGNETPARKPSTQPQMGSYGGTSEQDYYARYGNEVQPAMDSHDPDEEKGHPRLETSLRGDALTGDDERDPEFSLSRSDTAIYKPSRESKDPSSSVTRNRTGTLRPAAQTDSTAETPVQAPQPQAALPSSLQSLPDASSSDALAGLQPSTSNSEVVEARIKQHISTEVKSLFRLSQGVGIERGEFERLVRTELELLGMVEL
ncbi:MAG: hypothetical protein M1831_000697 [Alyxoria varia]|nr:MAG: hypothetical protein M1831_000697 [Alyxoria varia]